MSSSIEGRLEAVVDGRAVGWAWDPEAPENAVEVEVLVDGEAAASGTAEIEREVLADAGVGTGRYGFDLALPEELGVGPSHSIRVTAGPDRLPVLPFDAFQTISRFPDGPWHATTFLAEGGKPVPLPFVPEDEVPPDPGKAALVGKENWLFVRDDANLSSAQLEGALLLEKEDVERWIGALGERHRKVRELRIPYVFAVAPLKERLYSEFLPDGASLDRKLPARQVGTALRPINGGDLVDLFPALVEGRRSGLVFPRTDSCWSDRGAFFAYRELMREAGKRVVDLGDPLLPDEASFASRQGFRGDLTDKPKLELRDGELVALDEDGEWEEEIDVAEVSKLRSQRMPAPEHLDVTPGRAPHLYEIPEETQLPRAVLVGDAGCLALIPWLAEHFRRFVFLCSGEELPLEALELEAPDVVIHVVSERLLVRGP